MNHDPANPWITTVPLASKGYPEANGRIVTLGEMLSTRYSDETCWVGHVAPAGQGNLGYRAIKKLHALAPEQREHLQAALLGCTAFGFDVDRPGKTRWAHVDEAHGSARQMYDFLAAFEGGRYLPLALYTTPSGMRLVYAFSRVAQPDQAEATWRTVGALLSSAGMPVNTADPRTKDWTRLYRAPYCVRHDGPTWLPFAPVVWYWPQHARPVDPVDGAGEVAFERPAPAVSTVPAIPAPRQALPAGYITTPEGQIRPAEVRTDWQTTRIEEIPERFVPLADPSQYFPLAWDMDASGRYEPKQTARRVLQVLTTMNKSAAALAKALQAPHHEASHKLLPTKGGRNDWVYRAISDVCEASTVVLGATAEMAVGICVPLLVELEKLTGPEDNGTSWVMVAVSRIGDRWAEKREARRVGLLVNSLTPQDYASWTVAQIEKNETATARIAQAKGVLPSTVLTWARMAAAVGRDDQPLDAFLEWFSENGAGAIDGMGASGNAVLLDADHGRYINIPYSQLRAMVMTMEHLAPLKKHVLVEVFDKESGTTKIAVASTPALFGIRYLPHPWPRDYPAMSPVRYRVDRRMLVSQSLHIVPTIWHQIDQNLRPQYDEFTDSLLRMIFGDDFEIYGRYYFRLLGNPTAGKPAIIIETPPGMGKTTLIRSIARMYGRQGPSYISLQKYDSDAGLKNYSAEQLDNGPVFSVDDVKSPTPQLIDFMLQHLGSGMTRAMHHAKHQRPVVAQFAPILTITTNNFSHFSTAMMKACKSGEDRLAVVHRTIALSPERGARSSAAAQWRAWYENLKSQGITESDAKEHVHKTIAQHLLYEAARAEADQVQDPGTGRSGGGNRMAFELTDHSEMDPSGERYVRLLTNHLQSESCLSAIVQLPPGVNPVTWPLRDGTVPRTEIIVQPELSGLVWLQNVMIVGSWMVVRPALFDFGASYLGKDDTNWVYGLIDAGATWIHAGTGGKLKISLPARSIQHRVALIDLLGFVRDRGISEIHPGLAQHVLRCQEIAK